MEGYAKLASLMGANPEVAIFRRFGAMNAENVLYLQAELVALEIELKRCAHQIASSDDTHWKRYLRCWVFPRVSDETNSTDNEAIVKHKQTVFQMRTKLKEYSKIKSDMTRPHPPRLICMEAVLRYYRRGTFEPSSAFRSSEA